ncbi:hypothetical protein K523DRAFT_140761 [Schizophyllum commune Tattone D]|nr:hypothetical protein K523DRAFT_140761 [Schizophyllum commune Tattone D]
MLNSQVSHQLHGSRPSSTSSIWEDHSSSRIIAHWPSRPGTYMNIFVSLSCTDFRASLSASKTPSTSRILGYEAKPSDVVLEKSSSATAAPQLQRSAHYRVAWRRRGIEEYRCQERSGLIPSPDPVFLVFSLAADCGRREPENDDPLLDALSARFLHLLHRKEGRLAQVDVEDDAGTRILISRTANPCLQPG